MVEQENNIPSVLDSVVWVIIFFNHWWYKIIWIWRITKVIYQKAKINKHLWISRFYHFFWLVWTWALCRLRCQDVLNGFLQVEQYVTSPFTVIECLFRLSCWKKFFWTTFTSESFHFAISVWTTFLMSMQTLLLVKRLVAAITTPLFGFTHS